MVSARSVQFDGKPRCSGARELFRMNPQSQPACARRGENLARLRDSEGAAVAEGIAKFGQIFGGDLWQPISANQFNVFVSALGAASAKFRRDDVRAEKCAHDFERLLAFEFTQRGKYFALAGPVEAVAGLGFEGGGAVRGELRQMRECAGFQILRGRFAQLAYAVDDAAAGTSDFFISVAGDALFVFGSPRGGVDKVRVRVDEAGKNDAAVQVEFARTARFGKAFDAAAWTDGGDVSIMDEKRPIQKDARVSKLPAPARRRAA